MRRILNSFFFNNNIKLFTIGTPYKKLFGTKKQSLIQRLRLLVFLIKNDRNLFPVFYLSVWWQRQIVTFHCFPDKWTFGNFHRLKTISYTQKNIIIYHIIIYLYKFIYAHEKIKPNHSGRKTAEACGFWNFENQCLEGKTRKQWAINRQVQIYIILFLSSSNGIAKFLL